MPSISYHRWRITRIAALDELEDAHRSVGGTGRGRRYATQQINQAYAVLLSSQFQGFCRDLHSECVDHLVRSVTPQAFRTALRQLLTQDRRLDRGNPNPGNIGADFGRLGIQFWPEVRALDNRNQARQALLERLNQWRNAIAHQDFDPADLGGRTTLTLAQVRQWRRACVALAPAFDEAMRTHIQALTGTDPW
jgi:hypothetical protein